METKDFLLKYKYHIFLLSFGSVLMSAMISYFFFEREADLFLVFFTTLALAPFVYFTLKKEENLDMKINKEKLVLKNHISILILFIIIFLGCLFSFLMIYSFSSYTIINTLFNKQMISITQSSFQGNFLSSVFSIFIHNSKILLLCFLLSMLYGTGAILILVWNASVIAVAVGDFFRIALGKSNFLFAVFTTLITFSLHGIFEISSYFIGGLAGGIISVAFIRHHYTSKRFYYVLKDSAYLIIISYFLLFIGAIIETLILY